MALSEFNHYFQEEKMSTDERKKLNDSQFGIPSLRKYPLTDESHVEQAVRFFNKADPQYKPELARNIVKRAKELNMEWWNWFEKGRKMYPYLKSLSKSDQKLVKNKLSGKPIKEAYADELNAPPEADACINALKDVVDIQFDENQDIITFGRVGREKFWKALVVLAIWVAVVSYIVMHQTVEAVIIGFLILATTG